MQKTFLAVWPSTRAPQGVRVLWRALRWKEFHSLLARYGHLDLTALSPMDLYLEVYEKLVISGPHPSEVTAGIAAFVARHQLENNAFSGAVEAVTGKLLEKRQWLGQNYLEGVRGVVSATFHIPFDVLDEWDPDQLFERLVQAEYAAGAQFNPVLPPNPNQVRQQHAAPPQPRSAREMAYMRAKERRRVANLEEAGVDSNTTPIQEEPPATEEFTWRR